MPGSAINVYFTAGVELLVIVLHLAVIGSVLLSRRRDSSATLAWILLIALAPFVGILTYLAVGRTRMRRTVRRVGRAEARLREVLSRHDASCRLGDCVGVALDSRTESQVRLGNALASTPASSGNAARVLVDAAATYREMTRAFEQARSYIHVEFYIVRPDTVGYQLRDELASRAAHGIEVRVLCDAVGSKALPVGFWDPLLIRGGQAAYFSPLTRIAPRLRHRDRVDFRNHRKIVVVDGHVGFTGGINVGREYLGLDPGIGNWRDTHLRIEGPAVLSLQQAFLQDWLMTTGETLDDERYFTLGPIAGKSQVQIIDSGPDRYWAAMELYYAQAIALSRERVWITNPYFIPSATIEAMLTQAALRGVDVRLLLPKRSDSILVTLASRSYYAELLRAGLRIFEYERGFVHAKTMVVDQWVATIGSANMDMRSFRLNFEVNAFVFDGTLCQDVADQFLCDLKVAAEVTLESERHVGVGRRLVSASARLLSPML